LEAHPHIVQKGRAHAAFAELGRDAEVRDLLKRAHLGEISGIVSLSGRMTRNPEVTLVIFPVSGR